MRRTAVILTWAAISGCGDVDGRPDAASAIDAAVSDAGVAADAGPSCWGNAFAAPNALGALNTPSHESMGRLTPDERSIVFSRDGTLLVASRATAAGTFETAASLGLDLTGLVGAGSPTVTADLLTVYFSAIADLEEDIYVATRSGLLSPWGTPTVFAPVSEIGQSERSPYVLGDGSALYYASDRDDDLFRLHRTGRDGDTWTVPVKLAELSPAGTFVTSPVVSDDELHLFWQQGNAPYEARRDTIGAPFGDFVMLDGLNTADADQPTWVSPDGCRLYMWSNRPGGAGSADLYLASRTP